MTATATLPRSSVSGVTWNPAKQRWQAQRVRAGLKTWIGSFADMEAAEAAVKAWEKTAPSAPRYPTLGKTTLTRQQVEYAMSLAPAIRGF